MIRRDFSNLVGVEFGRLTILSTYKGNRRTYANCVCSCSATLSLPVDRLLRRNTRSCGCLQREETSIRSRKHGHVLGYKPTKTYYSWQNMRQRCTNPANPNYKDYGGRGIRFDPRWDDFNAFVADMGERPPKTSLERLNNDGDYCAENCVWADAVRQANNKRNSARITYQGQTLTITQLAREVGIGRKTLLYRMRCGLTVEQAVAHPRYSRATV